MFTDALIYILLSAIRSALQKDFYCIVTFKIWPLSMTERLLWGKTNWMIIATCQLCWRGRINSQVLCLKLRFAPAINLKQIKFASIQIGQATVDGTSGNDDGLLQTASLNWLHRNNNTPLISINHLTWPRSGLLETGVTYKSTTNSRVQKEQLWASSWRR